MKRQRTMACNAQPEQRRWDEVRKTEIEYENEMYKSTRCWCCHEFNFTSGLKTQATIIASFLPRTEGEVA